MSQRRKHKFGTSGTTVNDHESRKPTAAQQKRAELIKRTEVLINMQVVEYAKLHRKGVRWATGVRAYYSTLLRGLPLPGHVKVGPEDRRLVREWVNEAITETGLQIPKRNPSKKRRR